MTPVAWGLARATDSLGVHILQGCEATGFLREGGADSRIVGGGDDARADPRRARGGWLSPGIAASWRARRA